MNFHSNPHGGHEDHHNTRDSHHLESRLNINLHGLGWRAAETVEDVVRTTAYITTAASLGALVGASVGEITDHIPYIKHAVPHTIQLIAAYWNPDAIKATYLEGNMDKIGASIGLLAGALQGVKTRRETMNHPPHNHDYHGHGGHH